MSNDTDHEPEDNLIQEHLAGLIDLMECNGWKVTVYASMLNATGHSILYWYRWMIKLLPRTISQRCFGTRSPCTERPAQPQYVYPEGDRL